MSDTIVCPHCQHLVEILSDNRCSDCKQTIDRTVINLDHLQIEPSNQAETNETISPNANLSFPCKHCSAEITVDQFHNGRVIKCADCGKINALPTPSAGNPAPEITFREQTNIQLAKSDSLEIEDPYETESFRLYSYPTPYVRISIMVLFWGLATVQGIVSLALMLEMAVRIYHHDWANIGPLVHLNLLVNIPHILILILCLVLCFIPRRVTVYVLYVSILSSFVLSISQISLYFATYESYSFTKFWGSLLVLSIIEGFWIGIIYSVAPYYSKPTSSI